MILRKCCSVITQSAAAQLDRKGALRRHFFGETKPLLAGERQKQAATARKISVAG